MSPTLSIKPQEETENEQEDQPLLEREIDPRIPEMIKHRADGKTWIEVGKEIGLTSRAIYDIRQKEPDNQETEEIEDQPLLEREIDPRIPEMIKHRADGKTWIEVGKEIGLTSRAIYDIRQKEPYMRYLTDYLFPKTLGILGGIIVLKTEN